MASEAISDFDKAISFEVGRGSSLLFRKHISPLRAFVVEASFFGINTKTETDTDRFDAAQNKTIKAIRVTKYKNAKVSVNFGVRFYFERSKYSLFTQPEVGVDWVYNKRNSYFDYEEDKEDNENSNVRLDLNVNNRFGVEYFFSDRMSLEGTVGLRLSLSGVHLRGNEKKTSGAINSDTRLAITYYW